jgi:hypothetical protein
MIIYLSEKRTKDNPTLRLVDVFSASSMAFSPPSVKKYCSNLCD